LSQASGGATDPGPDPGSLVTELYDRILTPAHGFRAYPLGDPQICRRMGLDQVRRTADCVVLGDDAALQLGSPQRRSVSCLLWGGPPGLTRNRLWVAGPDLAHLRDSELSLGHIVVAELAVPGGGHPPAGEPPATGSLAGRLPGLMVRRLPGKLWLRIHGKLLDRGLTLYALGQCLAAACVSAGVAVRALDLILFVGDGPIADRFFAQVEPLARAAQWVRRSRQHRSWRERGWLVCAAAGCDNCDDRATCDLLRKVAGGRQTWHRERNQALPRRPRP
jgi:hypothetical protein